MMNQMMKEMMEGCCGEHGMPDFDKMKAFMERCGKSEFTDEEMNMMRQFCGQHGEPDAEKMKQLLEKCGCSAGS